MAMPSSGKAVYSILTNEVSYGLRNVLYGCCNRVIHYPNLYMRCIMKQLTFMGEANHTLDKSELEFYKQVKRQFGKKDADHIMISPIKYVHHFDEQTEKAYDLIFTVQSLN